MKRSFRKVFLLTFICALFAVIFALGASAAEVYTLSYYQGDSKKDIVIEEAGVEITLRDKRYGNSNTFYGWVSDDGVLYEPGAKITLTRDMRVTEAAGKTANNESELLSFFKESSWTYIKMGKDMTLTEQLSAASGWQVHVLDLNGHNLTISNCKYGTGAQRNGVVFYGKGTINFTSNNTTDGAFYGTSVHGYGDGGANPTPQRLWIGKDVTINSNVPLMRMENDATGLVAGATTVEIWGKVSCPYILRSTGLNHSAVNIYPSAVVNITSNEYTMIRDTSAWDDIPICDLVFHGGKISLPDGFKGWANDEIRPNCFSVEIRGGTFNTDIAKLISVDFKTVKNSDGTYSVEPNICSVSPTQKHKYLATDITVTCEADGTITYTCDYCKEGYVSERYALGHNVITLKTSDMSKGDRTHAATPGTYTNTCARCGSVTVDNFYPDPATTYVLGKARYERDGVKYVESFRTLASNLYGFSIDKDSDLETDTYLTTFGFTSLKFINRDNKEITLKQNEVVGIEIPLGTTKIYGGWYNDQKGGVPLGLFYKNADIEEVYLPQSLQTLERAVFQNMPNLKLVTGVEYISETIGVDAFSQSKDNAHLIFDTLKVNAKTVSDGAFRNALARTVIIGTRVKTLGNAFPLDAEIQKIESEYDNKKGMLKEIFVEDFSEKFPLEANPNFYDRTLAAIWSALPTDIKNLMFASINTGSALLTKANVYFDHSYETVIHPPTCIADGYTAYECVQCGLATKSDFVPHEGITHIWERSPDRDVKSTCSVEGYTTECCTICQSVQKLETLPRNNKHDWNDGEPDATACTNSGYYIRRRCKDCGAWSSNYLQKLEDSAKPLGHTFSVDGENEVVEIPATCGTPGKSIKTCIRCLEQEIVETEPTGVHHMQRNDAQRVAPTCAGVGYNYFYCRDCDATETTTIPQLSFAEAQEKGVHKWEDVVIFEPTTKHEGMKERICSLCHQKQGGSIYMPKLEGDGSMPTWLLIVVIAGSALLVGGIALTVYATVFKKNNASKNYKYKFNTFKK